MTENMPFWLVKQAHTGLLAVAEAYPLPALENVSKGRKSTDGRGVGDACGAISPASRAGSLNLIHTNKVSKSITARVPEGFVVAFSSPCGVWRHVRDFSFLVLNGATKAEGYSKDRKERYGAM